MNLNLEGLPPCGNVLGMSQGEAENEPGEEGYIETQLHKTLEY